MDELSDIIDILQSTKARMLPQLHAPATWRVMAQTHRLMTAKHELQPSSTYCALLYDQAGFEVGKQKLLKELQHLKCDIRKLNPTDAATLEKQLFGELVHFSFGANDQCYAIFTNLMFNETEYRISATTVDGNIENCTLERKSRLQQIIADAQNIYLSDVAISAPEKLKGSFVELTKQLTPNEKILIAFTGKDSGILISTRFTKDTKMPLRDYFNRSAQIEQMTHDTISQIYVNLAIRVNE